MEWIKFLIDFVLHLEAHLDWIFQTYEQWTYGILFLIVFAETGLVVTPFLPGDSLLFAVGAMVARGNLNILHTSLLLIAAAILGDTANYWIGKLVAPRLVHGKKIHLLNEKHLQKTHAFFEKYGGKTIIIARFVPIVRTFAPFVAGVGAMTYSKFIAYNVVGGTLWILAFLFGGYFFGNLPAIRSNFTLVVLAIIIVSILPAVIEFVRAKMGKSDFPLENGKGETNSK